MSNLNGVTQMVTKGGNPLAGITLKGRHREPSVSIGNDGQISSYNTKDALAQANQLMALSSKGEVGSAYQLSPRENLEHQKESRQSIIAQAIESPEAWASVGASLADEVQEQADRDGFLRKICQGQTLRMGEQPRVPMEQNIAEAIVATSETQMGYQRLTAKVMNPPEFQIKGNIRVSQLDLDQMSGDLLDKAYNDCYNAIVVAEDRLWKKAADQAVGIVNPITYIAGKLSPMHLSELRTSVTGWKLPVSTAILSNDFWNDINGDPAWATMLDPVTRHDLVLHGQIATLQGMNLLTDGYRAPNQIVLAPGEIYVVADPQYHGSYSTRGGIKSEPTSGANSGDTSKGWLMHETFSFVLANLRSVSKGQRI
jgi:hypothetical protein